MQQTRGPDQTETYIYKQSLLQLINDSVRYVGGLSNFDRYCVWRYTIGSASVNSQLIFDKTSDNAPFWTYLFFKYYKNTYGTGQLLPGAFTRWKSF